MTRQCERSVHSADAHQLDSPRVRLVARLRVRVMCATAIMSIAIPAWAQQAPAAAPTSNGATLGPLLPGDVIRIGGSREAELRGDFPVDVAGNATLPLLGERNVNGVPAVELKRRILAAYAAELRNQQVDVITLRRVSVLGAVQTPGVYLVDPTVGLSQVLAMAGGTTREGTLDGIQIRRRTQTIRLSNDAVHAGYQLTSGDEITVPERSWLSRNGQYVLGGALSVLAIFLSRAH